MQETLVWGTSPANSRYGLAHLLRGDISKPSEFS